MKGRHRIGATLAVAALGAAAAVGGGLAAATARLGDWYDAHEGLGVPCDTQRRQTHAGPGGFALEVPACWTVTTLRSQGLAIHQLRDPAPGLGEVAIVAFAAADAERWRRYRAQLERRLLRRHETRERRGPRLLAHTSYTARDPRDPWQYHEWHLYDDQRALSVTYRVSKVFVRSPKVVRMLDAIEEVVRTAHHEEGFTDVQTDG